jgi:hypothetical protein
MDAELRTASDQRVAWWARAKELEAENERLRRGVKRVGEARAASLLFDLNSQEFQ